MKHTYTEENIDINGVNSTIKFHYFPPFNGDIYEPPSEAELGILEVIPEVDEITEEMYLSIEKQVFDIWGKREEEYLEKNEPLNDSIFDE